MEYKDYYQTLGVSKTATDKEIKAAYRKLARQYHPDVNQDDPQAEAKFKEVSEAYEVLSAPEKRSRYDQLGSDWKRWQQTGHGANDFDWSQWVNMSGGGGGRGGSVNVDDVFGGDFSDFFSSVFGGSRGGRPNMGHQTRPRVGQDIEHETSIMLGEAYHGTLRTLSLDGRRLEVKIPAGAKSGTKVRVRGEGYPGMNGGTAGDLYIKVKVVEDKQFERKEDDLFVTATTDMYTALLGGEVRVPTLSGEVQLKIPAGSQNGQKFRLRGKGMPKLRHKEEFGDLYARLDVRLPTQLTEAQQALVQQLRELTEDEGL